MNNNDLFDNPMIRAAKASMTKEQLDDYQRQGEYMFEMMDATRDPLEDLVKRTVDTLQGGLHPSYLTESEQLAMENVYGVEWFKKFGWDSLDIDN
jgi:hypothetical protein